MSSITKRINKIGQPSYLIRVFVDQGPSGKQTTKSMTWKPPANMRPSAADKQAEKEAVLFEQRVRSGVVSVDGKMRFEDYAARWMDTAELAPKTREQYEYLLRRINPAIGHIPLEKLRADHIQAFYKNLREGGVRESGGAAAVSFAEKRKAAGLTQRRLSELSGVAVTTIVAAERGKTVSVKTAGKLCTAIGLDIHDAFAVEAGADKLSDRTVQHHHKLIRLLLNAAKKARILPHNVASEYMDGPKLPRSEARYLDDNQGRAFLAALAVEPDIRIRTALTLDLFTGARRGELCGLTWPDIDFLKGTIRIRRASQYVSGQGIIERPTKNAYSDRALNVTPHILLLLEEYRRWWLEQRLVNGDRWRGERERLFIQEDGAPIFPDTINHWLRGFLKKNGLPRITVHSLRHTFATLQLAAGVDVRTLQARTGHANASTLLNIYSHAVQSAQERAAQALDDMLLPAALRK